jgi:energy-coupling factor transport system ATP-binding protein
VAVQGMNIVLEGARITRGDWSLFAEGRFEEGIHLVSGEVGSGKSTLALALVGLLIPSSGTIVSEEIFSKMISFQFPEYHITGSTVSEECRTWGLDLETVLSQVNLQEQRDRSPQSLSRGELKRLNLACVLSKNYDLLVLDEPFSSLDCREKTIACKNISSRSSGITIIFTHEQSIFPKIDFLWEIRNNTLVYCGTPPTALSQWQNAPEVIRSLIAAGKVPRNVTPEDLVEASCMT